MQFYVTHKHGCQIVPSWIEHVLLSPRRLAIMQHNSTRNSRRLNDVPVLCPRNRATTASERNQHTSDRRWLASVEQRPSCPCGGAHVPLGRTQMKRFARAPSQDLPANHAKSPAGRPWTAYPLGTPRAACTDSRLVVLDCPKKPRRECLSAQEAWGESRRVSQP